MAKKSTPQDEPRQTGTAGKATPTIDTPTVPDPQTKGRTLTPDEKVDEASLESMDGSDPPSYSPSKAGSPKKDTPADKNDQPKK